MPARHVFGGSCRSAVLLTPLQANSRPRKPRLRNSFRMTTIQISSKTKDLKSFVFITFRKTREGVQILLTTDSAKGPCPEELIVRRGISSVAHPACPQQRSFPPNHQYYVPDLRAGDLWAPEGAAGGLRAPGLVTTAEGV